MNQHIQKAVVSGGKSFSVAQSRQKGFTLIEIAIVLIIFGVIAAASMGGMSLYKSTKNDAAAKGVNMIVASLKTKLKNDANTLGMTNATVVNAGVLAKIGGWSSSVAGAVVTINHPLKGTATFAPATTTIANDSFSIALSGVAYDACSDLARDMTQSAEKITIGATVVQATNITPATGIAIDNACGSAGVVTITSVYDKNP